MPATKQPEQHQDRNDLERDRRDALVPLIKEQVIQVLGKPGGFLQVQVRPLWANHYRANVFVGKDVGSAHVADSYFLTVDGDGNILASAPGLTKKY